jgi:ATP-dependent helicase HrpB
VNLQPDFQIEKLPLDLAQDELLSALRSHHNLVLVAEPGAGKTTRFPPLLLRFLNSVVPTSGGKKPAKLLVLEPRRIAARAAAQRIAHEQKWNVGEQVGYQVRFENLVTAQTGIQILTEGLLAKRLLSDPNLSEIDAVILDEFHERNQHTDLAIALLFELQQLSRPDLRIIVMSATLDAHSVSRYLGDAPIVNVPGKVFPVQIHHSKNPQELDTGPDFLDRVAEKIIDCVEKRIARERDVLVFLPGAGEIRGVRGRVGEKLERLGFDCLELHGSLSLDEQDLALRQHSGRNRVVLATNIAETSLTLDGIGTVIDSGLARIVRIDAAGFPRLMVSRISRASATQRTGRAGRQGPGQCHRLWNKNDELSMPDFEQPEIARSDLSEALMTLLAHGITDPLSFSWFEPPLASAIAEAQTTLTHLGFRESGSGALTAEGREALKLPVDARLARLVIEALKVSAVELGARLAALLSERDILRRSANHKQGHHAQSDVLIRLSALEEFTRSSRSSDSVDRIAAAQVLKVSSSLEQAAKRIKIESLKPSSLKRGKFSEEELALRLLLLAFPDRVARRRRPGEAAARMVGGRGIQLASFSAVETAEFFIAITSREGFGQAGRGDAQIATASRVESEWIKNAFPDAIAKRSVLNFSSDDLAVWQETAEMFRDLPLQEPNIAKPAADDAFKILQTEAKRRWQSHFAVHPDLASWLARLEFVKRELGQSMTGEEESLSSADFFAEVCFQETRLSEVLKKPLGEIYNRHLPEKIRKLVEQAAPASLQVPSGSRIEIHYPESRLPFIEVRIQEIFGWTTSPKLALGKIPLQIHLLSPGFKPVQVTSDLESFWRGTYQEIRKELRIRYPKHSWPEDPFSAKAEAKGRPRSR